MKKFAKNFCLRGMMFAWGGPVILTLMWIGLGRSGAIESLSIHEAVLGILSTLAIAFIAAGITVIYDTERLPMSVAALIHMAVLLCDYVGFYLLNGWISPAGLWRFIAFFILGFLLIWLIIYLSIRAKVGKLNEKVEDHH